MFFKLQLVCVKSVQEAVAVAVVDSKLDSALMGLIISLITQDTSQLLLYQLLVMHYLAIRGLNP